MKLRYLMLVMIGPMVAALGYLVWQDIQGLRKIITHAEQADQITAELADLSALVHELQKERGFSAGFVSSGGTTFAEDVRRQRLDTDRARPAAADHLREAAEFGNDDAARILAAMDEIGRLRDEIDAQDALLFRVTGIYTGVIDGLIGRMKTLVQSNEMPQLRESLQTTIFLTSAKEAAGLERATGATGLAQGAFPDALYQRFVGLSAKQSALLEMAAHELAEYGTVETLYSEPAFIRLRGARDAISDAVASDVTARITAPEWFATSTDWIDALHGIERDQVMKAGRIAQTLLSDAQTAMRNELVFTALIGLFVLVLSVGIVEYLIYRVRRLTNAMRRFTAGEFDIWIPGINGRDEVGAMARAVYEFKQETLAMRKAAAEKKADDEAIILGKAQKVVDLVTEGLAALAHADLSRHFHEPLDAEYDSIRNDFNAATQRLREVMAAIAETAVELDHRAQDLMQASTDLGARTTQQVETITSTNSRVTTLSSEVADYAENLRQASARASEAKSTADESGTVVNSAVAAMDRIAASSNEIGRIISMIEDITFQTNLPALNASVEAARAGEAGRGFAVVASEVRELAKRSGDATREIKALIDDSSQNVSEGVNLVGEAGDALQQIFGKINEVADMLGHIAQGSERQAQNLQDIASEVTRLNDLADRNMEAVDASGQTSQEAARISRRMTELIRDFRLKPDAGATASDATPRPRAA